MLPKGMNRGWTKEQARAGGLAAAAKRQDRRRRTQAALSARLFRQQEVSRLHWGQYKNPVEIAETTGYSLKLIQKDLQYLESSLLGRIQSDQASAMAQHVATLYERAKEAWVNSTDTTSNNGHRIQWFKLHLECMKQVADLLGYSKQAAALLYVDGDERFLLATGGIDALEVFSKGSTGSPDTADREQAIADGIVANAVAQVIEPGPEQAQITPNAGVLSRPATTEAKTRPKQAPITSVYVGMPGSDAGPDDDTDPDPQAQAAETEEEQHTGTAGGGGA